MKMTIEIEMDNEAFIDGGVNELKTVIENGIRSLDTIEEIARISLRDTNGNHVGVLKITE